jgi:hypothetical protein
MDGSVELSRRLRRLRSELADDGVVIEADEHLQALILDELDYARRPPQFERRSPVYGSIIVPEDRSLISMGELVELLDLDRQDLPIARRFADGRSTFLARHPDGTRQLACFRRSVLFEADMVEIQADTGAFIVQRTPVLGVTRLFTSTATVEWSGSRWSTRPNARAEHALLQPLLPGVDRLVLEGVLELAVHWLSPGRAGATLVLPGGSGDSGLDLERSVVPPALSVTTRHHYPALFAALMQTDLATVVDPSGAVRRIGVALRWSPEASSAVNTPGGMRHRSAAAYTQDNPDAVAVVVSEDGPVTVFHQGRPLSKCAASLAGDFEDRRAVS